MIIILQSAPPTERGFEFERDTFTFANDLVWKYELDPTGENMIMSSNTAPPDYSHRCFVMVRSARQFFGHARFDPNQPIVPEKQYLKLIQQVVRRNPRRTAPAHERITIPGYACLRAFSQANEPLLKAACGKAWESYFVRSHWRMVFPVWGRHQERVARELERAIRTRQVCIVHLFRFPHITINHGIVLFGVIRKDNNIEFEAYDPNIPEHPVHLIFEREKRRFTFARTHYWAGGPLNVVEIFLNGD